MSKNKKTVPKAAVLALVKRFVTCTTSDTTMMFGIIDKPGSAKEVPIRSSDAVQALCALVHRWLVDNDISVDELPDEITEGVRAVPTVDVKSKLIN